MEKIARVNWSRGQYSDVFRSTIIDPSPLKHGQKVKFVWGKTKKEYTAVVACYPLEEIQEPSETQDELAPRKRAKRKLISESPPATKKSAKAPKSQEVRKKKEKPKGKITCVKNVERSRKQFQLQTESDDSDFEGVVEDFKQLSPDKKRAKPDNSLLEKSGVVERLDFGEEEEAVSGDVIQHFNGNKNCPLFSSCAPTYSTEEIVSILICSEEDKVCTERPIACRTNASFVLDTSCLDHRDDYKADDNGSFRHHGKKVEHVELDDEGDVVKLDSKPDIPKEGQYRLLRTYWVHNSNPQFKRRAIELEDSSGNLSPLVMLQYIFDGDPESITVKPHGRAKKNQRPFFTTASGTRTKISEKATSSMGPSSIYDHLYLEAGDVMSRKSSSDVPRSVDQVKYERKKLRSKHEKDQLAELISLSNNGFVRNVQVGPGVRAVLATEEQLADIVKFCTDPEEFGILGIDVTYNIGDFYVTTTSYQHLSMIDKSTGKHPTFPGPMMIHTDEKQATFHYFASTLRENNSDIENILFVGSDRQRSMENGLAPQMPIAQFLACKKHVEDNVKMKLAALGILNKSDFLVDIFGDNTSRGLVDSESNEDFDAKLLHLKDAWESTPQGDKFYSYFVVHIAEDMKNRMILPIRRAAGLGNNFYYNNGTESINSSLKSEIEKSKNASSPGKPSKCSYGEFVNIASGFVSRYRRNVHRAVVGDGPYKLAPNYQHFAVTEDSWRGLSKKEKVAKISAVDPVGSKKLHQFEMEGMSTVLSAPGPSQMEASVSTGNHSGLTTCNFPDFACSGLPEYLRGSWDKAQDVICRNGVTKINESTMVVVSLTNPQKPHIVNRAGSKLKCDCERFKSETLCGHVLAVSHQENILLDVVASWEPKLSNIVSSSIPKRTGKKPGPQRYRPSRQAHERSVQDLEAPPAEYHFPEQEKFTIKWLLGSKITTCYGCKFKFRKTPSDPIPPEPYDIVLCRKQIRAYTPKGTTGLKFTAKPENTYFHLKKSCVQNDTSDKIGANSIVITEDDICHLNQIHRNRLKQEFGVNIL